MDSFSSFCDSSGNKETKTRKKNMIPAVKLSTDPQSVAARQRRHRISQRFKILQSLIPGGSKMDTASMLDEAINYVKFLKAQILLHQAMVSSFEINDDTNSTQYLTFEENQYHYQHQQGGDLYNYHYSGDHVPSIWVQTEENFRGGF